MKRLPPPRAHFAGPRTETIGRVTGYRYVIRIVPFPNKYNFKFTPISRFGNQGRHDRSPVTGIRSFAYTSARIVKQVRIVLNLWISSVQHSTFVRAVRFKQSAFDEKVSRAFPSRYTPCLRAICGLASLFLKTKQKSILDRFFALHYNVVLHHTIGIANTIVYPRYVGDFPVSAARRSVARRPWLGDDSKQIYPTFMIIDFY